MPQQGRRSRATRRTWHERTTHATARRVHERGGQVPLALRLSGDRQSRDRRPATHLTSQLPSPREATFRANRHDVRQRPTRDTEPGMTSRSFVQGTPCKGAGRIISASNRPKHRSTGGLPIAAAGRKRPIFVSRPTLTMPLERLAGDKAARVGNLPPFQHRWKRDAETDGRPRHRLPGNPPKGAERNTLPSTPHSNAQRVA